MFHQLSNYDLYFKPVKIMCDKSSAICLSTKFVHRSRAKHIDIKHHYIRDHVLKGDTKISFINIDFQPSDIFTKTF